MGFVQKQADSVSDFVKDPSKSLTNLSHDVAKSPIASAALMAAGSAVGIPPSVTAALLAANRTGMDGDIGAGIRTGITAYGVGKLMPNLGYGQAFQTAAGNTASGLVNGNNIGDSIKNAGISFAGGQVGDITGAAFDSDFAGKSANTLTQTALKGGSLSGSLENIAAKYATGELTDLSGLPPEMASIVVNLARNNKGAATSTAVGALTKMATDAVGAEKYFGNAVRG